MKKTTDENVLRQGSRANLGAFDEMPPLTIHSLVGGEFLMPIRDNIGYLLFLLLLVVGYITNRYMAQREMILEDNLRMELVNAKNYTQTRSAELTMFLRQSSVEGRLKQWGDTTLLMPTEAPYVLHVR